MPGTTRTRRGLEGRTGRLAIVLAYALVSIAWISFSDSVVHVLVVDEEARALVATGKGIAFVLVTASLVLGLLIARDLRIARGRADLEASLERYRMLSERSRDVVYRMRTGSTPGFDYVSPAIERITGHSPAAYEADPGLARELAHPDDRGRLERAAMDRDDGPILVRWLAPDGAVRWTEHRVTPVRDDAGQLVAIEGAARDVTGRVAAEAQRTVLMHAVEHSPVGVGLTSGPGTGFALAYVNPALVALTGMAAADLVGLRVFDCMEVGGPGFDDAIAGRLRDGGPFELEVELGRCGGEHAPATMLVSPQLSGTGEVEGILAILQDRSDAVGRSRAESILRASMDATPLAVVTTDLEGIVLGWNAAAERLFGWSADTVLGRHARDLDEPGWDGAAERRAQLITGTAEPAVVRPFRRADGRDVTCHVTTGVIRDAAGEATGFVSLVDDLTEALQRDGWNNRFRQAIDHAAEAVVITDLTGTITYVNPAFVAVSGYTREELEGRNPRVLNSGVVPRSVFEDMWHRLTAGEVWRGILVNRRKDGSLYEEEATLSAVLGPDGRPTAYVGVKRDLTLERRLAAGLSNELMDRAAVEDAMTRIEVRGRADDTAQSVCDALAGFGDVDNVELVYLPPARSLAVPIACVAATIPVHLGQPLQPAFGGYLRERATGGPWSDNHAAGHVDPRVAMPEYAGMVRVGAPIRHRGRTVATLIATTQTATPDAWIARHLKIVSELATHAGPLLGPQLETHDLGEASADQVRRIIEEGAFSPVFQPVCDLATRQPVGWEAFTRFPDGTAPLQRFADARAMGLGDALEIAAGQKAMEAFAALNRAGWLSINVSPSLVLTGQAPRIVGLASSPVVLELTEAVEFDDYARLRGAMDLVDPRVQLAVDDAGAGYASLRHVLELRPDYVKLEPAFVREIDRNETRQAMVAGMVHYAAENDTRLIAEGIETEAERSTLLRLGVRLGQGYLLGIPSATGAIAGSRSHPGARPNAGIHPHAGRRLHAVEADEAPDSAAG